MLYRDDARASSQPEVRAAKPEVLGVDARLQPEVLSGDAGAAAFPVSVAGGRRRPGAVCAGRAQRRAADGGPDRPRGHLPRVRRLLRGVRRGRAPDDVLPDRQGARRDGAGNELLQQR